MFHIPIDPIDVGQVGAVVLTHFSGYQAVEFFVHGEHNIPVLSIQGEIVHFVWIVLGVKQLHIVELENPLDGHWLVMLLGIEVATVLKAAVIHGADIGAFSRFRPG
jgi:hypothetical protein